MTAPGAGQPASHELAAIPVRERAAALVAALATLADLSDQMTLAVQQHDHAALVDVTARADAVCVRVRALDGALEPSERAALDRVVVASLADRLVRATHRNAYLIERAWAHDAATMRLLMSIARGDGDPDARLAASPYASGAGNGTAAYLDRPA